MQINEEKIPFWQDPVKRSYFFQVLCLCIVTGISYFLYSNTQANLARQNIATGFGFLTQEAGFEISESLFEYWSDDPYYKALLVGFLNTLKIALIGNLLAVLLGTIIGILRLSNNWLVAKISQVYVEGLRNIPLLLQLFFWYALFTEIAPSVKEAWEPLPSFFISQRGIFFPIPSEHPVWSWVMASVGLAIICIFIFLKLSKRKQERTGVGYKNLPISIGLIILLPLLSWVIGGAPTKLDLPSLQGFNFAGGHTISPEFFSLLAGLVLYTAAFIAEIVRAGILSVKKGQWEAAEALGLTKSQTMGLIILPQSLRVIIPPLTSQLLNLTKNSSLAVAIAYQDFVAVANTTMNQTGQAIEMVGMIMVVYLFFSLSTSLFMNWYNKRLSLVER